MAIGSGQILYRLCALSVILSMASIGHAQSLLEAMQMAVDTHPEIQAAKYERRARQHEIFQAEASYYPQVSLALGVGPEVTDSPSTNGSVSLTRREASLSATWGLFEGYGRDAEVERHQAREQSAKFNADLVVESVALEAAEAYMNVLRHQAQVDLALVSLENHKNIHAQMQSRFNSGVGSQADLDQVSGRLALAHTNAITAQTNFMDAQRRYQEVVGIYPDVEQMSYPGDLTVQLPETQDDMINAAVADNPVLQAAHADVQAAMAQHKAAKSRFYPRLSLEAEHSMDNDINGVNGEDTSTLIALRLRYDLFTGGRDTERKHQTANLMTEAQELRNDAYRRVVQAAHLNWNAYEAVVQQIPYLEQHVEAATNTKNAYNLQFGVGRRTLLDLLNTENEEVDARRALINGRHDLVFTQLRILNGIGRLINGIALTQEPEPEIRRFYGATSEPIDLEVQEQGVDQNAEQKQPAADGVQNSASESNGQGVQ